MKRNTKRNLMYAILLSGLITNIGFVWAVIEFIRLLMYDMPFNAWSLISMGVGALGALIAAHSLFFKVQDERKKRMKEWKESNKS